MSAEISEPVSEGKGAALLFLPALPASACHRHLREPIHQTTWKRPRGARSNLSRQTRRPVLLSSKAQLQPPQAWERRGEMMHSTKDAAREISLPAKPRRPAQELAGRESN